MNVVTGAFGVIGKTISRRLLERGERVRLGAAHTSEVVRHFRRPQPE